MRYLVGNDLIEDGEVVSRWINGYEATSEQDALNQHLELSTEPPTWVAPAPEEGGWDIVTEVEATIYRLKVDDDASGKGWRTTGVGTSTATVTHHGEQAINRLPLGGDRSDWKCSACGAESPFTSPVQDNNQGPS